MQAQIKLGRIFGVSIGLHYSWVIIALLITFSLAAHFHATNPGWAGGTVWVTAIVTGVLFFASIVVHELAHAAVARSRGLPVRSITLFALGGVAQIEKDAQEPKTEFKMAIVGPVASVLIGLAFLTLAWIIGWRPMVSSDSPVLATLAWLGYINVLLAVFNMIPGFPLDGGRVLRAIVWWATGDATRATRVAARTGQVVALLFITLGIIQFFSGNGFGGLWIAFIGWFLLDAARATYTQTTVVDLLKGVRVGDVMARDCEAIDSRLNLQTFVEEHLLRSRFRCFVVVENGSVAGLVTPHEVKRVERSLWPYTTISDVMLPLNQLHTVSLDTSVADALEKMGRDDVNQLPVVSNGRLEGVITRAHVLNVLQTRAELGA